MRFRPLSTLATLIALVLMGNTTIHAATVCVDPGKPSCEATVQAGVDAAFTGDTVSIAKGNFLESVVIPAGKNGLILKGKAKGTVIDSATMGTHGLEVLSPGVIISGVTIRNAGDAGIDIGSGVDGVEISKVHIQNTGWGCIETSGDQTVVEKSTLLACGGSFVNVNADAAVIRNNTMKHGSGYGIDVFGARALIEKNRISIIGDGAIVVSGGNAEIVGNSIDGCNGYGIDFFGSAPYVVKNQVVGSAGYQIECTGDCQNGLVSGNRVSGTGGNDFGFEIDADSDGLVVEKNRAERCNERGFDVGGAGRITLRNNLARDIGDSDDYPCYQIRGSGGHLVENNSCDSTADDGFLVSSGDGHTIHKSKVVDAVEDGIDIQGSALNVTVSDNKVSAGASAIEVEAGTTGNVTGNTAKGGRVDFCDESAGGMTATGNKFDTTDVAPCASDVD